MSAGSPTPSARSSDAMRPREGLTKPDTGSVAGPDPDPAGRTDRVSVCCLRETMRDDNEDRGPRTEDRRGHKREHGAEFVEKKRILRQIETNE
jgi:hypothetical protein